jgi:sterol desaturase/sphingolipid hydroxylase (fatty acid hydroxylase superfamily)
MNSEITLLDAALRVFPRVFLFDGGRYLVTTLLVSAVLFFAHRMADHRFWGNLTTTTHHDLHHNGSFNHNYGLYFTWWDRLMGTEHPCYREIFREVTSRPSEHERCDDVPVAVAEPSLQR